MTENAHGWTIRETQGPCVISLAGDWIARLNGVEAIASHPFPQSSNRGLAFDISALGQWDSALIVFLSAAREQARKVGGTFDESALPAPARRLLALVAESSAPLPPPRSQPGLIVRLGSWGLSCWGELFEVAALVGSSGLRGASALRGRSSMRHQDLLQYMRNAGIDALPIVLIVNILVGGILAFVGAVQLRRFGADIYVATMVGIAVVREMAALMTAIILAGRTGGAYAANIATMQANEEIDALHAFGIPIFDYLILPRILALTSMMPILYLFGCALGIIGGFGIAVLMLNISPVAYIETTRSTISGTQFFLGLTKSLAFGALIAIAGCRVGLRAGRSANEVGQAATTSVVVAVVGIIAMDAIFALCANALGI